MTMREKIGNEALRCLGKHRSQVGCAGNHDWCAQLVSTILKNCGINIYNTFVGPLRDDMLRSGKFYEPEDHPIFGDTIDIDWDHKIEERPLDHVVICVGYNEHTRMITYINGNGSSSEYVTKQTISVDDSRVMYWQRYKEESETVFESAKEDKSVNISVRQLSLGDCGKDVEAMQAILIAKGYSCGSYGSDGDFGKKTKDAVKNFQTDRKLEVDGIAGAQTWKELLRN